MSLRHLYRSTSLIAFIRHSNQSISSIGRNAKHAFLFSTTKFKQQNDSDLSAEEIFNSFRKQLEQSKSKKSQTNNKNKENNNKDFASEKNDVTISMDQVDKMAFLSRLKIEPSQKETVRRDFEAMLALISKVQEANTSNVEPLYSVLEQLPPMETPQREDEKITTIDKTTPDEILNVSQKKMHRFYVTPQVN